MSRTVDRGLTIVAAFAEHGPTTVERVATATEVPLATAYRYVAALVGVGWLAPTGRGRYALGERAEALARLAWQQTRPDRVAVAEEALARVAPGTPPGRLGWIADQVVDALDEPTRPKADRAGEAL